MLMQLDYMAVLTGAYTKCCPSCSAPPHLLFYIWGLWQALDLLEHNMGQQELRLDEIEFVCCWDSAWE